MLLAQMLNLASGRHVLFVDASFIMFHILGARVLLNVDRTL